METWAEIDELNRGHYGRGKSDALLLCEMLLREYEEELRRDDLHVGVLQQLLSDYLLMVWVHEQVYLDQYGVR